MRFVAILMAVYIFGLMVMPCHDQHSNEWPSTTYTTTMISEVTHSPIHSEFDDCSPFCTCQCCGSYFDVNHSFFQKGENTPIEYINRYQSSTTDEFIFQIKRPPQSI